MAVEIAKLREMNTGQLRWMLRATFLRDTTGLNKVTGEPFKISEITERVLEMLKS